jgi:hypothetical protein
MTTQVPDAAIDGLHAPLYTVVALLALADLPDQTLLGLAVYTVGRRGEIALEIVWCPSRPNGKRR